MVALDRARRISFIGLPIMGGMVSGVILGLVDSAMVSTLGNAALGAVGFSTFASFIYLGLFYGFSIAVQAFVSRRMGENLPESCGISLSAALISIGLSAPLLSGMLYFLIPHIFPLINSDPEVVEIGIAYIRWLILQAVFVGFIAAMTGFWNGVGLSRIYLPSLIAMHVINVLLNYVFIFGKFGAPEMGAEGAGFATALASVFGTLLFFRLGFLHGKPYGFLKFVPDFTEIKKMLRLAIPAGMQQLLDTLALTTTYSIVGMVGTMELACYSVLINFINLVGLPAWGLGAAGATLVGRALGEKNIPEAAAWAWDVIKLGVVGMFILGAPFWLFPEQILSLWIHDATTRELAIWPTRILGLMIGFNGVGYMLATMLNGAGDVKKVTLVNLITQWCLLVPGAYFMGPVFGYGLIGIWMLHQFAYRAGHVFIFAYFWRRGDWSKIII
ncbi:MAG: MATE family multidrug resistance protein [Oceanicoccus sp.]|jgi:MATE family multidrug resistance protein